MTTGSTSNSNHHALHPRDDRETLSALFDGELSADAMRFALKRLDHDAGWRDTCGRWQLIGDALRGEATAAVPSGFAVGVMRTLATEMQGALAAPASKQAVQADSSVRASSRRRWIGGAALAASVAMAAVLVVRPFPGTSTRVPAGQVASGVLSSSSTTAQASASQPASVALDSTASADAAPTAVAAADVPRTTPGRRAVRSTRAASRPVRDVIAPVSSPAGETATVVAAATPATGRQQPFHPPTDDIVTRPWPRAVLPGNAAAGALTVDFGESAPSLYPFEPRLPSQDPSLATPQTPDPQR